MLSGLEIIRNCYEKCSKISDNGLRALTECQNLVTLKIVYTRKFKNEAHNYIAHLH
jgi:hypothetical protein